MKAFGRPALAALVAAALWSATLPAAAQEAKALGEAQSFVLSLEHLAGYSYQHADPESDSEPLDTHQFGLFTPYLGPFGSPARLGFHYFVAPPFSVGALATYADNDRLGTLVLIGVRAGVAIPMSAATSLWVRAGICYSRTTLDFGDQTTTYSAVAPGGDVLLAIKPLAHFGFLVGGTFENTIWAKEKVESDNGNREMNYSQREIALSLGAFLEL